MQIIASAPGKLILAGDYAVLEGAPAVVVALQHRAKVVLDTATDCFRVNAPELGIHSVAGVARNGRLRWQAGEAVIERLHLVTTLLETLMQQGILGQPVALDLDTRAFYASDDGGKEAPAKLGLGSSAALTVALAGGLIQYATGKKPDVANLVSLHRKVQGGRGSGLDVATSLTGGSLVYTLEGSHSAVESIILPDAIRFCCVWTGHSASTGKALEHLAGWRHACPGTYDKQMTSLGRIATRLAAAVKKQDADSLMANVADFADQLQQLGQSAGIDIVSASHRQLAGIAAHHGIVYKPSGAGGGDVGVALTTDEGRLAAFKEQAEAAGFHLLADKMDPQGLVVTAPRTGG